jgi:hypothetical protein
MTELFRALGAEVHRDVIGSHAIFLHDEMMRDPAFQHEVSFTVMRQRRVLYKVTAVTNKFESPHLPLVIRVAPAYAIIVGPRQSCAS